MFSVLMLSLWNECMLGCWCT